MDLSRAEYDQDDILATVQQLPRNRNDFGCDMFSQEIALILIGMGMEKYLENFKTENVNLRMFLSLNADDLDALNITDEKDRNKILSEINANPVARPSHQIAVPENPKDDLMIARNLLNQTAVLTQDMDRLLWRMRRARLADYYVTRQYNGADIIRILMSKALQQSQCISSLLHRSNDEQGLIQHIMQKEKRTLPKFMRNKLNNTTRLKKKKIALLFVVSSLGCALAVCFRYFFPSAGLAAVTMS